MRHQRRLASREHEREMRQGPTDAERVLWSALRGRRFARCKFRRQHRLGPWIVDFYAPALRLAIELDGAPHFTEGGRRIDELKTKWLAEQGIAVARFENRKITIELEGTCTEIVRIIQERASELQAKLT
ncbi:MAG TPA: endonuclease domain-containing protein [Vicinamibacteria bacterium]|nr:endonuclease domain-containing protein [Vicinamibacteria bacterium]